MPIFLLPSPKSIGLQECTTMPSWILKKTYYTEVYTLFKILSGRKSLNGLPE
jgi:hypothetical protein